MLLTYFVLAVVVVLMCIVGTELTSAHFKTIIQMPGKVLISSLLGLVLLPLGALLIGKALAASSAMAVGLVLIAACPGGALSNYYCYLLRSNVALSVVLTGLSSMHAFLTLPWILGLALPHLQAA